MFSINIIVMYWLLNSLHFRDQCIGSLSQIWGFVEKYELVGKLLKDGEEPTDYSDEEDAADEQEKKSKDD